MKRGDSVEVGNVNSIGQRADKPKISKIASEPNGTKKSSKLCPIIITAIQAERLRRVGALARFKAGAVEWMV